MGFVSLSEDVIKRHESDVHDLLRALEASEVSEASQHRAMPGFTQLVAQLEALLNDPKQPFVVRMLSLREAERNLTAKVEILTKKNADLGNSNSDLNDRIRRAVGDNAKLRAELAAERANSKRLATDCDNARRETGEKNAVIASMDRTIKYLNGIAMSAQVDRRLT